MAGETWRQQLQVAKEATYGTYTAATRRLYTRDPAFTRGREPRPHKFATGTRERTRAMTLGPVVSDGKVLLPVSADELLEWLLVSVKGNVSPTTPAGYTNGRLWTFTPSSTLDSLCLEEDDGADQWKITGVYGSQIQIQGSVLGENLCTITTFNKNKEALTSLTGALSERTPTFMEGWETRLYADTFGGTIGTTQLSGLLESWDITINLNPSRKYRASNTLALHEVALGEVEVTASLMFEASSALAATEYANWDAETARLLLLEFGQNSVIDAGTNEVQTLTEGTALTAGTFTLSFRGQTTSALAFNATAAATQAALEALGSIGSGNVAVTGGPLDTTPLTVTFQNQLGGLNMPQLTSNQASLTGTFTHATTTPGTGSKRAVRVGLPGKWGAVALDQISENVRMWNFTLQAYYDTTNLYSLLIECITNRTAAWV